MSYTGITICVSECGGDWMVGGVEAIAGEYSADIADDDLNEDQELP